MPRRSTGVVPHARRVESSLVDRLAEELRSSRESGQPIIYETSLPNDKLRVTVVWDDWDRLPLEERTEIILEAYERVEGPSAGERIALASGLTIPEAYSAGLLPYQIITAFEARRPVTPKECRDALIEEVSFHRSGTRSAPTEVCHSGRSGGGTGGLSHRLPNSEPVWIITQDPGRVEDWSMR